MFSANVPDNPAALPTSRKVAVVPLNNVKIDATDSLLSAPPRPRRKTPPGRNLGIRVMGGRHVRRVMLGFACVTYVRVRGFIFCANQTAYSTTLQALINIDTSTQIPVVQSSLVAEIDHNIPEAHVSVEEADIRRCRQTR